MERNENMCLESTSSLTENRYASTSLGLEVGTVCPITMKAEIFVFAHKPSMLAPNTQHVLNAWMLRI